MKLRQAIELTSVAIRNMILGSNLTSLALAGNPKRMIAYVSENLFLYKAMASKRGIPPRNVFEVLPSSDVETIRLGSLTAGGSWFRSQASYTADILSLCLICRIIKPKAVFEIGTLNGYTTFHLALNTPDEAQVYTLDLPKSNNIRTSLPTTVVDDLHIQSHFQTERYCFENSEVAAKITCLFGDSATFDFSPFYGKVDFFFIDGAHSYDYARSDTLNALKCCHPGSVIAWHDFGRTGVNGVSKWIRELSREREIYATRGGSLAFMIIK